MKVRCIWFALLLVLALFVAACSGSDVSVEEAASPTEEPLEQPTATVETSTEPEEEPASDPKFGVPLITADDLAGTRVFSHTYENAYLEDLMDRFGWEFEVREDLATKAEHPDLDAPTNWIAEFPVDTTTPVIWNGGYRNWPESNSHLLRVTFRELTIGPYVEEDFVDCEPGSPIEAPESLVGQNIPEVGGYGLEPVLENRDDEVFRLPGGPCNATARPEPVPEFVPLVYPDERTVIFPAAGSVEFNAEQTRFFPERGLSEAEVEPVLETLDSHPDLTWAAEHERFIVGSIARDTGADMITVYLTCEAGMDASNDDATRQAFEYARGTLDGGDCFGEADFDASGELLSFATNGEA